MKINFYKSFRSLATAILALAILLTGLSLDVNAQTNIFTNGGFEDDLTGWRQLGGESSIVTDDVFAGAKSGKIGPTAWSGIDQVVTIDIIPGETYRFSAAVKSIDGDRKKVAIQVVSGTDFRALNFENGVQWQEQSVEFTMPETATQITVYATNRTGGVALLDRIELVLLKTDVTGVTLNVTEANIVKGETLTLEATVAPADATDPSVAWTTSDAAVATVDAAGVVTAVAAGTATITVTTTDGGFTAAAAITVSEQNQAVNLLVNGNFEDDLTGWRLVGGDASIVTENVFEGTKSGKIGPAAWSSIDQVVTTGIIPGEKYRLTAAVNFIAGERKKVALQVVSGVDFVALNFPDAGWEEKSVEFIMPLTATQFTVYATNRAGGGEALLDNIKVELVVVPVTGVTLNETAATLAIGETTTLIATVAPADATDKSVAWTTSDAAVATVDAAGVVTAVAAGTATITVTTTDGGFTAAATITVSEQNQAVNLLVNGNFEDDLTGWRLVGGDASIVTDNVFEGTKSGKIGPAAWSSIDQVVTAGFIPGEKYRLTAAVNFIAGERKKVALQVVSGVDFVALNFPDAGWEEKSVEFIMPLTATQFTVYATNRAGGGEALLDNIKVELVVVPVTGVTLNETAATLAIGETTTLIATVAPADAADKSVAWTTSDAAVATVDAAGVVTAVAAGTATITVTTTDGDFTATATITVEEEDEIAVTGVTLNETAVSLLVGQTVDLVATVAPAGATNTNVTWSSSDNAVATVSESGVVTAVAVGVATITVTTVEGGFTANAVVTVSADNTSVEDLSLRTLTVYPNPVRDGLLFLSNANLGRDVTVQLISVDGRIVLNEKISSAGHTVSVNISNVIENGLYIIRVYDENRNYTSRIIISN
jgi:uncharacterized protein YjdB